MTEKAIIFDLNGIFIKSPLLSERIENDFKVSKEEFVSSLSKVMNVARSPNAPSTYDLFKPDFDLWNIKMSETQFLSYWFSAECEDKNMINYAKYLKREGWKIFILSNNFKERVDYYSTNFEFLNDFDKVYYSCQTGFVKPDKQCFIQILNEYNLNPHNCYYFDDSDKNVSSAKEIGINAHKFENLEETKNILKNKEKIN
jgi:HAD superfamily hydrolase (TIGR01509 family)